MVYFYILLSVHLGLCGLLVLLVLLQQGKGADAGAAFAGSSDTLFGAGGAANVLTKFTTGVAICFMITSILLIKAYGGIAGGPSAFTELSAKPSSAETGNVVDTATENTAGTAAQPELPKEGSAETVNKDGSTGAPAGGEGPKAATSQ